MSVLRFEAIGVPWEIETPTPLDDRTSVAVHHRIDAYDRAWSRYRPDSLVSRIAREPGTWELPQEAGPLLEVYRVLYDATRGRMSPLVGTSLERLGLDAALSLRPSGPALPSVAWDDAIAWDGRTLVAPRPVSIDIGAAGKGQLCDLVGDVLREHGVDEFVVDASGDILRRGAGAIRVGLEHPADPSLAVGIAELGDGAICASASNRRRWSNGIHHILDATTGLPADDVVATWVTAPDAMTADAVATALFLAAPAEIPASLGAEWTRITSSGRIEVSAGFPGEVFR